MKKVFALMLIFIIILGIAGCGTAQAKLTLATENDSEDRQIVSGAAVAVEFLRQHLKNPHSIIVYSIKYKGILGSHFYKIVYSAENNVGGRIEDTYYARTSTAEYNYSTEQAEKEGQDTMGYRYNLYKDEEELNLDVDEVMALLNEVFG